MTKVAGFCSHRRLNQSGRLLAPSKVLTSSRSRASLIFPGQGGASSAKLHSTFEGLEGLLQEYGQVVCLPGERDLLLHQTLLLVRDLLHAILLCTACDG